MVLQCLGYCSKLVGALLDHNYLLEVVQHFRGTKKIVKTLSGL